MNVKKSVLVGAFVATLALGAGGVGLASAATGNTSDSGTSLVDRIASKFNLNKADVQAVFDQDRAAHHAQMEAHQKDRLAQAVKAGTITQAQSDHITSVLAEIDSLRGTTAPNQLSDSVRQQIRAKMHDLRQWAKDNNIDMKLLGPNGHHFGGRGHDDATPSSSSSTS